MLLCTYHRVTVADITVKQVKVFSGPAFGNTQPCRDATRPSPRWCHQLRFSTWALLQTFQNSFSFYLGKGPRQKQKRTKSEKLHTWSRQMDWHSRRLIRCILYLVINATYARRLADSAVSVFPCHIEDLHWKKGNIQNRIKQGMIYWTVNFMT